MTGAHCIPQSYDSEIVNRAGGVCGSVGRYVSHSTTGTTGQDRSRSRYSSTSGAERWHVGWDPAVASYYAQNEPARTRRPTDDAEVLRTVAGDRVGEVPTLAALDAWLAGRVQVPACVRERLADDGPTRPESRRSPRPRGWAPRSV